MTGVSGPQICLITDERPICLELTGSLFWDNFQRQKAGPKLCSDVNTICITLLRIFKQKSLLLSWFQRVFAIHYILKFAHIPCKDYAVTTLIEHFCHPKLPETISDRRQTVWSTYANTWRLRRCRSATSDQHWCVSPAFDFSRQRVARAVIETGWSRRRAASAGAKLADGRQRLYAWATPRAGLSMVDEQLHTAYPRSQLLYAAYSAGRFLKRDWKWTNKVGKSHFIC